ncbi:PREDICTED: uncharacterized protein LOC109228738 isoform X2 [Nicotiana attenuata]|uniref:uncharacterized protein LOC109228738 isoform X2 n=1 Tax=Nicotiana attenuata TaxID=49451 RepID=UPI00090530A2|nr:PREDICTED: uncharacterized protein LOC109228738 isoform X2 [Nicotiana attenuata]
MRNNPGAIARGRWKLDQDMNPRILAEEEEIFERREKLYFIQGIPNVSYKWLSRNFLVSSDSAKRLLQEFVEKHGNGLEVVYSLSGWLKTSPSTYHIRLVSTPNLAAKKELSDDCSVQVYSVQACIPKDPVALWNAEFVQAEELFRQPLSVDNCLLDNRFCGVSNPFVKRNGGGTIPSTATVPQVKSGALGLRKSNSTAQAQPEQKKVQVPSPSANVPSTNVVDAKSESRGTSGPGQGSKLAAEKDKVAQLPAAKKIVQSDKSSAKNGGALANMWGRVSTKPKADSVSAATSDATPNPADNAAQICTPEVVEDRVSDDDDQQVSIRRTSNGEGNRKRRVIFDFSDEEDEFKDAVNLASPDPPKQKSILGSKQSPSTLELEKQEVKKAKEASTKSHEREREPLPTSESEKSKLSSSDMISEHVSLKNATVKDEVADAAPVSPKRRKVLKTRIDERGREVTEVVWEGEDAEAKVDGNTMKKPDDKPVNSTGDRPPMAKKSPALGSTAPMHQPGKAGNKKAGNKDPKQGNILSFFKKT